MGAVEIGPFRVLLSSASLTVGDDLFVPGSFASRREAEAHAALIRRAQPGIEAWALPADADAADVLRGGYRAIRHTFPNGGTVALGYVRSGYAQQIARWTAVEAQRAVCRMRAVNPGHTFEAVEWRDVVEHTSPHGVELKAERRRLIERGIQTSLVAYDGERGVFAFDEYAR